MATTNVLVNETWYIDLGASQHFTFQKNIFFDPKKSIYMGNNSVQEAIRKGSVHLTMRVGECEVRGVLHKVVHVFGLVNNLFLVNKTIAQGLKIKIEQEKCSIKNHVGEIFARVVKENRFYILLCSLVSTHDNVQVVQEKENLNVWHERFGHLGGQSLRIVV